MGVQSETQPSQAAVAASSPRGRAKRFCAAKQHISSALAPPLGELSALALTERAALRLAANMKKILLLTQEDFLCELFFQQIEDGIICRTEAVDGFDDGREVCVEAAAAVQVEKRKL